ncbi:DUF1640 domain-containing protein [Xylella fastidiosa]|uniref:DUF1640 domain-containing protein n=1 Tax=Xylella fastidiosa TaxID=2371 RepID=UPI000FFE5180|nr:DUF1640 domain-containing protein [Xylella fastidiosa]RWA36859.1 DUF1640 domain-containing protein [Xylella fastidiosa subsp. multiplex]
MAAVAFDTLRFANRLKTAGVPPAHAEAEAEALAEVLETNLQELAESEARNSKALARLEANMEKGFAQVDQRLEKHFEHSAGMKAEMLKMKGEMMLHRWMLGVIVTGIVALVAKAFF